MDNGFRSFSKLSVYGLILFQLSFNFLESNAIFTKVTSFIFGTNGYTKASASTLNLQAFAKRLFPLQFRLIDYRAGEFR